MILIQSQSKGELSTDIVMQWIEKFKGKVFRFNGVDMIDLDISVEINNESSNYQLLEFKEKINVVWYRRYKSNDYTERSEFNNQNYLTFEVHIAKEFKEFYQIFINSFSSATFVTLLSNEKISKMKMLILALKYGLLVPKSMATNNKKDVLSFLDKYKTCIVKPLGDVCFFKSNNLTFKMLTKLITKDDLKNIPNNFTPSFIQEYIKKEYEIRCFYWFGEIYSMAIFSQNNEKTKIDFRNYDNSKPNRTVPYKLPKLIEEKITSLMNSLCLNTGSIDLIKTINNLYYFLEINPNGQFSMVSTPCNYYLEKIIAKRLMMIDKNNN